ncbi:hypothetical protein [Candidatus Rickettsiella viridis]|uniref:hypothetical protein n=1 Tax=Candidatus Rickettsiella viridis TaxID=676208 RepID=UPI000F821EDB|nr:hypothetical protein [Candidatus Rickettsiella viridis]
MLNKKIWFSVIEILVLLFILFCVSSSYLSQEAIGLHYNADMLYLPIVFQDLFHNGGHYVDWSLAPIPYFFPDWIIFFIAFIFTKQVYFQLLVVACLNILLLYLSIRLIYQALFSSNKAALFALMSISIFTFLSIKYIQPFEAVLLPNIHVGGFTVGLFYIWIQIKLLAKKQISQCSTWLFFAVLICFATGMSDLLYILQFTVPVFFGVLLFALKKKSKLSASISIRFITTPVFSVRRVVDKVHRASIHFVELLTRVSFH